ncbi:hypothetical protein RFI_15667 [Reticulomyxa filosa]|uniref:Uncharacterized protein n=1 Tax=Reticulomyxa filosa TaxID=46433 RepID=X6N711_RETFI|nr:hypothetical protein RFI_15667 [Reticulomyxa filosa]|eukprot:ETO21534.1 hypothetical protein RFI_15667 [Reticulomyxa filosa]
MKTQVGEYLSFEAIVNLLWVYANIDNQTWHDKVIENLLQGLSYHLTSKKELVRLKLYERHYAPLTYKLLDSVSLLESNLKVLSANTDISKELSPQLLGLLMYHLKKNFLQVSGYQQQILLRSLCILQKKTTLRQGKIEPVSWEKRSNAHDNKEIKEPTQTKKATSSKQAKQLDNENPVFSALSSEKDNYLNQVWYYLYRYDRVGDGFKMVGKYHHLPMTHPVMREKMQEYDHKSIHVSNQQIVERIEEANVKSTYPKKDILYNSYLASNLFNALDHMSKGSTHIPPHSEKKMEKVFIKYLSPEEKKQILYRFMCDAVLEKSDASGKTLGLVFCDDNRTNHIKRKTYYQSLENMLGGKIHSFVDDF